MARPVDKLARRQALLDAGAQVLSEGGFGALQMREVARRAGVAAGTPYTYFATKEALFAALYAQRLNEMLAELEQRISVPATRPRSLFIQFATMYRELYAEFGREIDVQSLVTTESVVDPTTLEQLIQVTGRTVAAAQAILQRFGVEQSDVAMTVLWSLLSGLAAHFTGPRSAFHTVEWDEALDFTADRLLVALVPPQEKQQ